MRERVGGGKLCIFLHGSGDIGSGLRQYIETVDGGKLFRALRERGVTLLFPSARPRFYSLAGDVSTVWHDRVGLDLKCPEDTEGISASVDEILTEVERSGVPLSRTAVFGFSMGGGLALQLAYGRLGTDRIHQPSLLGCCCLSSFLYTGSEVYQALETRRRGGPDESGAVLPPLLMAHGSADSMIPLQSATVTHTNLKELGVEGRLHVVQGLGHDMAAEELAIATQFLTRVFDSLDIQ